MAHAMVQVRQLDQAIAFYQKVLGLSLADRHSYEGHPARCIHGAGVPDDPRRRGSDGGAAALFRGANISSTTSTVSISPRSRQCPSRRGRSRSRSGPSRRHAPAAPWRH
ncbi:VOC family protein [Aestuariivirga sp.]|uniref:VOC family protein n=1 Tax=Aestuariivirga sp. TaxID=2650926 RepID=UPI0035AFFC9E